MKPSNVSFDHFLDYFPELAMPVTLTDETVRDFSRHNDPLPFPVIEQFLLPLESDWDEMAEIVPCFRLPDTYGFHAIVYWRAGLMNYHYVLATFTKKGELISRQVIAGTISDGKTLVNSVAVIEENWEILILSGKSNARMASRYDAASSMTNKVELLPDGRIVSMQ